MNADSHAKSERIAENLSVSMGARCAYKRGYGSRTRFENWLRRLGFRDDSNPSVELASVVHSSINTIFAGYRTYL